MSLINESVVIESVVIVDMGEYSFQSRAVYKFTDINFFPFFFPPGLNMQIAPVDGDDW